MGEPATIFDSIDTLIRQGLGREKILELCDALIFVRSLGLSEGNISEAARILRTNPSTIHRWLKNHQVEEEYISGQIAKRDGCQQP